MEGSLEKPCIICRGKTSANCLGIDACRACAVFFRRFKKSSGALKCRNGNDNCDLDRDSIWVCRKCRYNKICTAIDRRERRLIVHHDELETMRLGPELQMYRIAYNNLCRQRLMNEFGDMNNVPFNDSGLVEAKASIAYQNPPYLKMFRETVFKFLCAASRDFAGLKKEQQYPILKHFLHLFPSLEGSYHTMRHYADQPNRIFVSYGRYIELDNIESFFAEMPPNKNIDTIVRMTRDMTANAVKGTRHMTLRLEITPEEYVCLLGLLLWSNSVKSTDEGLAEIAEKNRQEIFRELHDYYRYCERRDYATRLGELLLYLTAIEAMIGSFTSLTEIYLLLDVIDRDWYDVATLRSE